MYFDPLSSKAFNKIDGFIKTSAKRLLNYDSLMSIDAISDVDEFNELWAYGVSKGLKIHDLCKNFFNALEKSCVDYNNPEVFETFFGENYKYGKVFLFLVHNYAFDVPEQIKFYGYEPKEFTLTNRALIVELLKSL